MYKMKWLALVAVIAVGGIFAISMTSCEELKEACGPCGSVKTGDTTISGDAALDGFFQAVGSLDATFGKINGQFEGDVLALAEAFEVTGAADMEFDALVEATVTQIETTIDGNIKGGIDGGFKAQIVPPKCEVNVQASFEAQAKCEAKAGCEVDLECSGGELSFACEGKCSGSVKAAAKFPSCTVEVTPGSLECEGICEGSCAADFSAQAECEGTCEGTCHGDCSAYVENTSGGFDCAGACNGECQGDCVFEASAEASCKGECRGSCKLTGPTAEANCTGDLGCEGKCEGSCSGGCEGNVSAPKCEGSVECEASAECEAQASAQASASASCTPPTLDLQYSLSASLEANAEAKAKFMGQLKVFRSSMINITQGMANLKILFDANAAAEIGIEPPAIELKAKFDDLVNASLDGDFDIAPGLIGCTIDGVEETVGIIGGIGAKMEATVSAQAEFYAILF